MKATSSILLILFLLVCCSTNYNEQEYIAWVRDYENGLHVVKHSGDFEFDVQYVPSDYRWLQNKQTRREEGDELQYFTLTLRPAHGNTSILNGGDEIIRQRQLYYLSYSFQNDMMVEEFGQTFPCLMYHFERTGDSKSSCTFLLGFEKAKKSKGDDSPNEAKLIINSSFFGSLPIHIKVSKDNIPALAI